MVAALVAVTKDSDVRHSHFTTPFQLEIMSSAGQQVRSYSSQDRWSGQAIQDVFKEPTHLH